MIREKLFKLMGNVIEIVINKTGKSIFFNTEFGWIKP